MKVLPLKKVKIDYGLDDPALVPDNAPEFLDYRTTIMGLLKTPKDPQAGATFEETAEAMPIWLKFREHKMPEMGDSEIMLEDAEQKFVWTCINNAKFVQRSYELWQMGIDIKQAPDHLANVGSKDG